MPIGTTGTFAKSDQSDQALANRNHIRVMVVPLGSVTLLASAGSSPLTRGLATIKAMVAMIKINFPLSLRWGIAGTIEGPAAGSTLSKPFLVLFLRLMIQYSQSKIIQVWI
jgi:hypothetical protein